MTHARLKMLVAAAALSVGVGLIVIAGVQGGWVYYMSVDQFVLAQSRQTERVRLHGVVGEEGFEASSAALFARFELFGQSSSLQVEYSGVIPDMFRPGHDVVVEGRLDEGGVFQADTLLTKCGSRYESDGEAPHAHPAANAGAEADE